MTISALPPAAVLMLGALLVPLVGARLRPLVVLGLPLVALAQVWLVADGPALEVAFLDYRLTVFQGDALSRFFATIFCIMAFGGGLYAINQRSVVELAAAQAYAGAAVGVAMAGDLISFFVFWELMAVASTLVVWAAGTEAAYRAARRYVMVHLIGGVVLMAGIAAHVAATGSVALSVMAPESAAQWLILAGILVNAGAPPLSAWVPDAYPEASYSGAVFLSAFTTKAAVYALLRTFAGAEILIFVGLYMVFYGIIYALLENDMRRILAYSIVNQVGFMVTGIGIGTEMALNGSAAHAFAHIIYKALLLMSAGAVLHQTGRRKCTELGGLFQSMPLTMLCGVIGALSISAFPLTSGFVSKSMISEASALDGLTLVWFLLAAASAGVFLHAGIKFPWFVFFHRDSGLRPPDPPWNMRAAMVLFSALCIGIGVWPQPLYALLPFAVDYVPYTAPHVVNTLQLLSFSGLAFFLLLPVMRRTDTLSLDLDWLYRTPGPAAFRAATAVISAARARTEDRVRAAAAAVAAAAASLSSPSGLLARTRTVGGMVGWVIALLVLYLILNFV